MNYQGHQGDVFFEKVEDALFLENIQKIKGLTRIASKDGYTTLVEGEATHHHHLIQDGNDVEVYEGGKLDNVRSLFLVVNNASAPLEHIHVKEKKPTREHNAVDLGNGLYIIRTQQQSDINGSLFPVTD